jgi:hypothetical protein
MTRITTDELVKIIRNAIKAGKRGELYLSEMVEIYGNQYNASEETKDDAVEILWAIY